MRIITGLMCFCFVVAASAGLSPVGVKQVESLRPKRFPAHQTAERALEYLINVLAGRTQVKAKRNWPLVFSSAESVTVLLDTLSQHGYGPDGSEQEINAFGKMIQKRLRRVLKQTRSGTRVVVQAERKDPHVLQLRLHTLDAPHIELDVEVDLIPLPEDRPSLAAYRVGREIIRHILFGREGEEYLLSTADNVESLPQMRVLWGPALMGAEENRTSFVRRLSVLMAGSAAADVLQIAPDPRAKQDEALAYQLAVKALSSGGSQAIPDHDVRSYLQDAYQLAYSTLAIRRLMDLEPMIERLRERGSLIREQMDMLYNGIPLDPHQTVDSYQIPSNVIVLSPEERKSYPALHADRWSCPDIYGE